jgi:hypothetical protein
LKRFLPLYGFGLLFLSMVLAWEQRRGVTHTPSPAGVAILLPVAAACPLIYAKTLLDWDHADLRQRMRGGAVFISGLLVVCVLTMLHCP